LGGVEIGHSWRVLKSRFTTIAPHFSEFLVDRTVDPDILHVRVTTKRRPAQAQTGRPQGLRRHFQARRGQLRVPTQLPIDSQASALTSTEAISAPSTSPASLDAPSPDGTDLVNSKICRRTGAASRLPWGATTCTWPS
jgi:hypothetical protein